MNRKLVGFRTEHNITQKDMAELLKISTVTYGRKERKGKFNQKELIQITEFIKSIDKNMDTNFFLNP